ncbi:MAG: DUF1592 domain-containing protein [Myxococcota bacterium]
MRSALLAGLLLSGCRGCAQDDPADGSVGDLGARAAFPARRLSVRELRNTIPLVTGVDPTAGYDRLPPDATDDGFDRVAEAQTVSAIHLEAFDALADDVAEALFTEAKFDDLAPACADASLPPLVAPATATLPATGLTGSPDWALTVEADHLFFLYSPTVTVTTTYTAPAAGRYRLTLPIEIENDRNFPAITATADGVVVGTWTGAHGLQELVAEAELSAGLVALRWDFEPGDELWEEDGLTIWTGAVEGPLDPGAETDAAAREACADALIPALAERAWRRPPTAAEVARLSGVWDAALADGTASDGLRMIVQAVLTSPHFLYLVELGEPVADRPGWYRLTDAEQAARLSYALCEGPPDDALVAAARAGELHTVDQVQAHARRLLDSPCGHATVTRFHRQWLRLDALDTLARDPSFYPEFTPELGPAMREETEYFLDRMVYDERAGLQGVWEARTTWVGPDTAWLYGLAVDEEHTEVELPEDRAGPLTHPAVLATTSKFSETSPVLRGVYVLEQLLCEELAPPPSGLDITPPPLDDAMTTRERWAAHSSDPACSGCHAVFDPIGFALEGYDALGVTRTEENGQPIDVSGAIPTLGVDALSGGRAVAEVVAASPELRRCFARQWLRFGLGRLEDPNVDAAPLEALDSRSEGSVYEALLALTGTDLFLHRVVPEEAR